MEISFSENQYTISKTEKQNFLLNNFSELTKQHRNHCIEYHNILNTFHPNQELPYHDLTEIPFIPVHLFKTMELKSISHTEIFKILTSSGTTSSKVSKIFLDRNTASLQAKSLVAIVSHFIGKERLPMLIIDHADVIKNRESFSARGAGILGFANFGKQHTYLLNNEMEIDWVSLQNFLDKHKGRLLIFGFTFMIWQYFYQACKIKRIKLNLEQATLIHGGGWKKLSELNISNEHFKKVFAEQFNIKHIHNYYGMVEQVGSIFMECASDHLHTPMFADIIIRDPLTLQPLPVNQSGLIQVLSILPQSYPGYSLLTEDLGTWLGEDDCSCGLKGKYFRVHGRLPKAELRGCSDTHAYSE